MNICHCLFIYRNKKIISLVQRNKGLDVISIAGKDYADYDTEYWKKWVDYACCSPDSMLDICLIYDEEMIIPKDIIKRACNSVSCIWSEKKIKSVFEEINIDIPIELYDTDENLILTINDTDSNSVDKVQLRIKVISVPKDNNSTIEITPFIEGMLNKLTAYDKENEG